MQTRLNEVLRPEVIAAYPAAPSSLALGRLAAALYERVNGHP